MLIGKGCHPLTAALYLKRVEGRACGAPIRPKTVTARTHAITRMPGFRDQGHIRCDYYDIDDFAMIHVEFDDGTIATIVTSDIVLGGIHNWLEVCANNHRRSATSIRTRRCSLQSGGSQLQDIYVVEKIGTSKAGRVHRPTKTGSPATRRRSDYRTIADGEPPESDSLLAAAISTIYDAYLSPGGQGAIDVRVLRV